MLVPPLVEGMMQAFVCLERAYQNNLICGRPEPLPEPLMLKKRPAGPD